MSDGYQVRDFMMPSVTSVAPESSLLDAILVMRRSAIRHLPVVEGEKLVGVLTERDIQRASPSLLSNVTQEEYNSLFENTKVERIMFRDPVSVSPDTSIRDAVTIVQERKVGCLPVVEDGRLVGILTRSDLLGILLKLLPAPAEPQA